MDTLGSGLEISNAGALSGSQKMELMEFKINTKIENEKYLRSHKEVELLLAGFLRLFHQSRSPRENPAAADGENEPGRLTVNTTLLPPLN
ncbi:RIIa domain-containing protein 1 isoform X3 [Sphaerodactylus townsendi]|uniref:RIIa domain-containing protein 1 isoform X3 n=1 Tax=Sphaerodactylus townsendi TaxID=933632 RepID=UPI0020273666|nr:RIIa domain-containing protein 1 isoform X3 [Sphaerodactylus townsendi]